MTSTPQYRFMREGFTLIELLVVVAIIGLLSSVVLASLGTARERARVAKAQTSMTSVQKIAAVCMSSGTTLGTPPAPWSATAICTGTDSYPPLPSTAWSYLSGANCRNAAGAFAAVDTNTSDGSFLFCMGGEGKTVSCHETGCRTD